MARRKHGMRTLYLDIETYPAVVKTWSLWPKYISHKDVIEPGYMLCFAAQWEGERELIFRTRFDTDWLYDLYVLLDQADCVVWYNGDAFDQKHINRELVEEGYSPPTHYETLDLYKVVKKHFKFQSNKLDYVCQELGLNGKVEHEGMALWDQCAENSDKAWTKMERYNKRDIKILRDLYKKLLPWIGNKHPNVAMWIENPSRPTCPSCGSTNLRNKGIQHTKVRSYKRYKCKSCGTNSRERYSTTPKNANVLKGD